MQDGIGSRNASNFRKAAAREKILIISPQAPEFDKQAGWARLHRMVEILARHYEVFFLAENFHELYSRWRKDKYTRSLTEAGAKLFLHDYDLRQILRNHRFKLAILEFFDTVERNLRVIREVQPFLNVVYDAVDVGFLREQTWADLAGTQEARTRALQTKEAELAVCRSVEAVFTVTPLDRDVLLNEESELSIEVIPTIHTVECQHDGEMRPDKSTLLFVGGFKHLPNVDAVKYFCSEILPLVVRKRPALKVLIAGASPPEDVAALASKNVKILGHVPDLKHLLRSSDISIAPLRFGAGMKGKIGEALAYGLPVVTTSIGVQGLALRNGEDIFIADSPQEFAQCIDTLLSDAELRERLRQNGIAFIKRTCIPAVVEDKLIRFIEERTGELRSKRQCNLEKERLDLNFDVFQRHQLAADLINRTRADDQEFTILDIGGHGILQQFLIQDFVVTVDNERYRLIEDFVFGNGMRLPFKGKAFDYAVSFDVLEHIPSERREAFLNEMERVSRDGIILAAPFEAPLISEAENFVNEFYKGLHGNENPWLIEHIANRLPSLEQARSRLEALGFHVSVLPNGYLPRWVTMMGLTVFLERFPAGTDILKRLNRLYNSSCYAADNREPCYRRIVVATRQDLSLNPSDIYAEFEPQSAEDFTRVFEALAQLKMLDSLEKTSAELSAVRQELRDVALVKGLARFPLRVYRKLKREIFRR
ncbi:MAG: glycosyltransferase [Candidatus Abyssobacteria bacterium SURF_5]|uniref:Glycosyltransferase n=1 Tax=Abyssobacteria bacterium (strain SURF_5) TaxID=2093360 RepID=A0A3A4NIG0_ABYX5|nr:MAG: glycosyltransferase [Candidatus Abyssubacteria bacterium SURF_5]